ncbi:hypothetical protein PISL3812_07217 [Talaromyces islandicus]|uniref:Fungal N-terminal domain-containing protein n=1 Tax=Talaromyces islandicus TaxID=28573 RepID=A0A0U1M3R9_TALIS|nr:hypothetical protein PISL3812_07217 [Talaromyces islandicus]
MSGLEAIGVAASIIQIADLGARVSIKLSTFYHKVKQANDNIQNLSTDVALTCTVLKQLGDSLQQDENVKLYSPDAFSVARDIMGECDKVFRQIESAMEDDISASASTNNNTSSVKYHVRKAARKLHFVFLEPQLSVLQSNLDRLKSTMLLMLNVIIYAGQVRRKETEISQQEQKEIIEILADEQKIKTKRYQQLQKAIESAGPEERTRAAPPCSSQDDNASFGVLAVQNKIENADEPIPEELAKYANLIKSLLMSVDEMKLALDKARYQRIRNGVLTIHDKELPPFQSQHGNSTCSKLFDGPLFERRESGEDAEERLLLAIEYEADDLRRRLHAVAEHGERLDTITVKSSKPVMARAKFTERARSTTLGRTKTAVTYPFRKVGEFFSRLVNRPKHKNVIEARPQAISLGDESPGRGTSDRPIFELPGSAVIVGDATAAAAATVGGQSTRSDEQGVELSLSDSDTTPSGSAQMPLIFGDDDSLAERNGEGTEIVRDSRKQQVVEEVQDLILKWTTLDVSEIE